MKYIFLLAATIITSITCFSQDLKQIELPAGTRIENTVVVDGITTHSYSAGNKIRVNGIPFLQKEFSLGIIVLRKGVTSNALLLRYDVAKDLFEIKNNNDTLSINKPHDINYILINNHKFIYDPHFLQGEEKIRRNGYLEVIEEGNISLFLKRNKKLSYDSFVSNYGGGGGTKEYYYVDKEAYFGKIDNQAPFLINTPKSFMKNVDSELRAHIKTFIKENHIKFKNADDLTKLVNYYNSL